MLDRIAHYISTITNPLVLLIPVPYLLVYRVTSDSAYAFKWSLLSIMFLALIGVFVYIAVKKGIFTNLDVSRREQRPMLFIITGGIILAFFITSHLLKGPKVLDIASFGILFGVFILSVINMKIKASIHVATATVFILTNAILYNMPLFFYLLIPLIAWSRVRIKRHTISETIAGCFVGGTLVAFLYSVLIFVYHINI